MAGNVREWTMEWYSNTLRAYRGGVSTDDGATYPASYRIGGSPTNIDGYIGFRIALFLEDRSKLPEEIPNITFTYNPPLEKMTNENVIVTANTNSIKYTVETSKNGIDWDSASSLTYEKNGEVFARLMNEGTQVYFETEIEDWEYDVIITAKDAAGNESSCREIICFVAGTKVHTEEGLKNIEEIKVGEKVYTQNLENNTVELKEVKSVFESTAGEMCTVYVEDEEITSTLSHPYYVVDRGWVEAGQLQKGDKLLDSEGRAVEINKVEKFKLKEKIKVYNLSVEDHNNYFVTKHKLLVHNQGCGEQ